MNAVCDCCGLPVFEAPTVLTDKGLKDVCAECDDNLSLLGSASIVFYCLNYHLWACSVPKLECLDCGSKDVVVAQRAWFIDDEETQLIDDVWCLPCNDFCDVVETFD